MVAGDDTPSTGACPESDGPAEPAAQPVSSPDLAELQRDLKIATRSGRYALIAAVTAAVISAGASAWSSVHVSSTRLDREQRFTAEQAVRSDRREAYANFVVAWGDLIAQLGRVRAGLEARHPDRAYIVSELGKLQEPVKSMIRAEATVRIVGSEMGPALRRWNDALMALWQGPDSLAVVKDHLERRPGGLTDDDEWRRVAAVGISAIDKFASDRSIDEIAERAREDLGSG